MNGTSDAGTTPPVGAVDGQLILQTALDAAKPQLTELVSAAKDNFMSSFGNWVQSSNRGRLEELFVTAGQAKISALMAKTADAAHEFQDIFETTIASIETLGLAVWITAKAEAIATLKSTVRQLLTTIAAVAGAVIKTVIEATVPGAGALIGPIAGAGVEHALNGIFGNNTTATA